MKPEILNAAYAPQTGVKLKKGLLFDAFENNRSYLKKHYTLDDLRYPFLERVGKDCPRSRPLAFFWETDLEGSNAGRFLMGAGNTLRYCEDDALRAEVDALVQTIGQCADEDGYCMGFHKEDFMILERANYTRSWLTRGLLAAYSSGNAQAGQIIRRFQDWFNNYPGRRKAAELHLSYQGMIAEMEVALSELGKAEDWQKGEALYAIPSWIEELRAGNTKTIWQRPNDGAHGYELNGILSYLELYRLSGKEEYLQAVLSAWDMFKKYWIHIGGNVAICEEHDAVFNYLPGSRHISADKHTGETCNNVWWMLLNHQLLQLFPNEEKYAREIEESLYNVLIPAQGGDMGIRYHAYLHGVKDDVYTENTCCEGTGTMLYGMLPALIYSLHTQDGGVTVNLFADSEITFGQSALRMQTAFPEDDKVTLTVTAGGQFPLRIRVPGWVSEDVVFYMNGQQAATGKAGSYVTIDRLWKDADSVSFVLPRKLRTIRYEGMTVINGYERYALMYGPVLMAVSGQSQTVPAEKVAWNEKAGKDARADWNCTHWIGQLDDDGNFVAGALSVMPYYQVPFGQEFTCFPLVKQHSSSTVTPMESYTTGKRRSVTCGSIQMELAGIPAGTFLMGQEGYEPCEKPVHPQTVSEPFFMGVYSVTQAQYGAIMGVNPSKDQGDDKPVEMVSYDDALIFIDKLNALQNEVEFYLPTEAQLEFACRSGSRDANGYGTDILRNFSQYMWNYQQLGTQSVETSTLPYAHPVGLKLQNAWGLYDMLGNVGEWCADVYRSYEPDGFCDEELRVIRGGCFNDLATYCRCATRNALEHNWKNRFTGFRVAARVK